jgi:L-alanine-DL-glutamate epimerase-like enolase superfamily enzyme
MGESEFTRFDIRDALAHRAADVLQPDCAIIGGITETMRVAHLADTYQVALAPHCWGSAVSFMAGISVSFASPSAIIIEYSLGGNPMLHEMVNETISVDSEGNLSCPQGAGLGLTINHDFVKEFTQKIY